MIDFMNEKKFLVDRVVLPRRKTNLLIAVVWNIVLTVPILWSIVSLLRAGFLVSVPTLVVVFALGEFYNTVHSNRQDCAWECFLKSRECN